MSDNPEKARKRAIKVQLRSIADDRGVPGGKDMMTDLEAFELALLVIEDLAIQASAAKQGSVPDETLEEYRKRVPS